jgi:hypothetical protein
MSLGDFLKDLSELLQLTAQCKDILFRREIRQQVDDAITDALDQLETFRSSRSLEDLEHSAPFSEAGLVGAQLRFKLQSFADSKEVLSQEGGADHVAEALDKGAILLNSLAGAIPAFGSFAAELVDFLMKEIAWRWKFWRRSRS